MMSLKLEHVGILVADFDRAVALLERCFGLRRAGGESRTDLRTAFFQCGDARIELIDVLDERERNARLRGEREARIDHIALQVESLSDALDSLAAFGIQPTGPPRNTGGYTSAWTAADTSQGITFQLMELRPAGE